jgi:MFS family permease
VSPFAGSALLRLLRDNADYRRLFLATVVSFLGDWFAFVAVSGFVTESTGHKGLGAVVYAASVLPVFLFSPLAGVVADRVDRRVLMVWVEAARVPVALGLVLTVWWDLPWAAIGLVALLAALSAFFEPITAAVVPNLVAPEDLGLGQAALGSVWGTMLFVGAAVGGLVSATLGREASFVLNALTFAVSGVLVWRIRRPMQEARAVGLARSSFLDHLGEVGALLRARQVVRALFVTKAGVGLANGIVGLLPAFALVRFGAGDVGIGVLLGARGLGALMGPFVAHALVRGDGRRLLLVSGLSMLAYGAAYVLLPLTHSLWMAAGCVAIAHLGGGAQWVLSTYGLQLTSPDALRGRVMSLDFGVATLSIGVSSLGAALAVEQVGLDATAWGLSALAAACGILWLGWTRPLWRALNDPLRRAPDEKLP